MTIRPFVLALAAAVSLAGCVNVDIPLGGGTELQEILLEDSEGWFVHHKVLLVDVSGVISEEMGGGFFSSELTCSPAYIKAVLNKATEDESVKAVVLRVDSPGGTVSASETIAREIALFRETTGIPVIAQVTGLGCSGAYYLSAGCDAINAQPSSIIGSIGVIAIFPKYRKLADKVGFDEVVVKSGAMKDIGSGMRDMTEEERAVMQGLIDSNYNDFLDWIETNRPEIGPRSALKKLADGRIYTSAQALESRLVDNICFLDESLALVKEAAGLKDAKLVTYGYTESADYNLYTPATRANPMKLDVKLPPALQARRPGFYFLWMPGE